MIVLRMKEDCTMPDIFGERLRTMREHRRLTLRGLSTLARVPVSTLSAVETGERPGLGVTMATGKRLACALGVTLDYLGGMYEEPSTTAHPKAPALHRQG